MTVVVARVVRIGEQSLVFPRQPLVLGTEGLLERELLEALPAHELVVRVRTLDRVAEERDQPHVRQARRHPLGHGRVEEVVRSRLSRDEIAAPPAGQAPPNGGGEEGAIPVEAAPELVVEEVELLPPRDAYLSAGGGGDVRVGDEVVEERGRPRALGADDDEGREDAGALR
jgi:hypothetical protein